MTKGAEGIRYWWLLPGIPVFAFFALAAIFDLGSLMLAYPDYDLTPYLAARSLARDGDLAYTRVDSDRYFREVLVRPSHFTLVRKHILSQSGGTREYLAFYSPGIQVFLMAPFVGLLGFRGILLMQGLLLALIYAVGYLAYRGDGRGSSRSALNAVVYYTLIPLPILALIPSHHLLLFALLTTALFAGLRKRTLACAVLLALATSIQPWSLLLALLLTSYWQYTGLRSEPVRFAVFLGIGVFLMWGMKMVTYPPHAVSEARTVVQYPQTTVMATWDTLPLASSTASCFAVPSLQRVQDFLFGRTTGFFVYGFPAFGLFLSSIWLLRDRLINRALLFLLLFLIIVSFIHASSWGITAFFNDFWLILAAVAFFLRPIVQPAIVFWPTVLVSCLLVAPLLVNPYGALANRAYYVQSFPCNLFPMELTLAGKTGMTSDPQFQFPFNNGKMFLLNDDFYPENDFLWVKGESTLEFLMESRRSSGLPALLIRNGSVANQVTIEMGPCSETYYLQPSESARMSLDACFRKARRFREAFFLHGTIASSSGYVPKLLSRDNPDYRFLGCQVRLAP